MPPPVSAPIGPAEPRGDAQVHFSDGQIYRGPIGTPLSEFVQAAYPLPPCPIAAALVDGDLKDLRHPVSGDMVVQPIDTSTNDGMRIYQRSLSFVLVVAVHELFPKAHVVIDHSVTLGGFFCEIHGRETFSQDEIDAINQRMSEIVEQDDAIIRERMALDDAIKLFSSQGYDDKARLLAYREEDEIDVYCLRGVRDYFYGLMTASTGMLRWFHLETYPPGFILRLPQRFRPTSLPARQDYPKLMQVYRSYGQWLDILGVQDVGSLNRTVESGRIREVILVEEALQEKTISDIADAIANRHDRVRLVLIAGPSSSGKTTFSRRLAVQLLVTGLRPSAIGLDDYFVDRDLTPRDASGDYDFESLDAIDRVLFNRHLNALMADQPITLPHYNFRTGKREVGGELQLSEGAVLIVEGIHGLNPALVADVDPGGVFRVYVSALTQLNIDHHNRVPTTDTRLLRRIVRDAEHRGYSARDTIQRWESVRRGEERNIFPYQENADVMFNSALAYELSVLKPLAEPLLLRVPSGSMESLEARRLLSFLRWVLPCPPDLVPDNSLLREFVGGSILEDFRF